MVLNAVLQTHLETLALLPLELRDPRTGKLVARTVLRSLEKTIRKLEHGEWLVTLSLPSGKQIAATPNADHKGDIDLEKLAGQLIGAATEAIAAMFPGIAQIGRVVPDKRLAIALGVLKEINWRGLVGNLARLAMERAIPSLLSSSDPASSPSSYGPHFSLRHADARLRFYRGSAFKGGLQELRSDEVIIESVEDEIHISSGADAAHAAIIVQLLRPEKPSSSSILPPGATLRLSKPKHTAEVTVDIAVTFGDTLADQAVRLRAGANLSQLVTVATNITDADLLTLKAKPVGAAVCLLYLLLRTRESSFIESAIASVPEAATKAPDVAVIKGELAARSGEHRRAIRCFLESVELGVPFFGQGLSYLSDRLSLYRKNPLQDASADPDASQVPSREDEEAIDAALRTIEPFSANCDFSAPVTTYYGLQPETPGQAPLPRADFNRFTGFPISLS
ncbi:MAG: hypothetical protein ACREXR_01625 [Gammaproteobacteria bacterium]